MPMGFKIISAIVGFAGLIFCLINAYTSKDDLASRKVRLLLGGLASISIIVLAGIF